MPRALDCRQFQTLLQGSGTVCSRMYVDESGV